MKKAFQTISSKISTLAIFILLAGCASGISTSENGFNAQSGNGGDGSDPNHNPNGDDTGGTVYQTLRLSAESTDFRPVVKVVLIVDNSPSMAEEQVALSNSVGQMLDEVKNSPINMDVMVYTTTSEPLADLTEHPICEPSTEYFIYDVLGSLVPAQISSSAPTVSDGRPYTQNIHYRLRPSVTSGSLRAGMSDASYATERAKVVTALANLGVNGSQDERGFCSLGRVLAEDTILKSGDYAAFMIISDADDSTNLNLCLKELQQDYAVSGGAYVPVNSNRPTRIHQYLKSDAVDMQTAIIAKSKALFGDKGFFISTIIDHSTYTCVNSEAYGVRYKAFVDSLGDQGMSFPICAASYYPALQNVQNFLISKVNNSYQMSLASNQSVTLVKLERAGTVLDLNSQSDYQIVGASVRISDGLLQAGDTLLVTIKTIK